MAFWRLGHRAWFHTNGNREALPRGKLRFRNAEHPLLCSCSVNRAGRRVVGGAPIASRRPSDSGAQCGIERDLSGDLVDVLLTVYWDQIPVKLIGFVGRMHDIIDRVADDIRL